jgi:hypothetical protein
MKKFESEPFPPFFMSIAVPPFFNLPLLFWPLVNSLLNGIFRWPVPLIVKNAFPAIWKKTYLIVLPPIHASTYDKLTLAQLCPSMRKQNQDFSPELKRNPTNWGVHQYPVARN